jgi:lipoate-protein ligase A
MKDNFVPTPEEDKRHKKMMKDFFKRNKDIDLSTKHPSPKEMEKLDKKMKKELKKNKDIIGGPMH